MATAAPLQPTAAHQPAFAATVPEPVSAPSNLTVPRGPVEAKLSYYTPPADGSRPYGYVEQPPEGVPQRNYSKEDHEVTIEDLRGRETDFTLDKNAFEVLANVPSATTYTTFDSDDEVEKVYYPEVEKLLLDSLPGAHRIFIFDHTIRHARPNSNRSPVTQVHIDQTPASAKQRVEHHLPDEAAELVRGRYRIVNVWRPLNPPVYSFPLAIADSSTVRDEDLVGVEHRYPTRTGETAGVKYHKGQKWYYLSGMLGNERLLLKCSDSDGTVGGYGRAPHTAFIDSRTPDGAPGRESIEVRALVFG
ncbi:putative methyltransferase [Eremomyces bilateralis CBS 781.70]|uniref:Methyltransferase n=1 Tax=Eremomyces bilateralis CBS 781.70 TaxID=1392243 RepID=A0A6G1FVR5_9PEZI|nr:putative methyltransferase [Eremomyces bilateralis CBS 781.70]KAF1809796.1 putative methyltransferase [Eremomyces bilateralis CBS 781.70]